MEKAKKPRGRKERVTHHGEGMYEKWAISYEELV